MSLYALSSLRFSSIRSKRAHGSPLPRSSAKGIDLGMRGVFSRTLGYLLSASFVLLIFMTVPVSDAMAQIPLPEAQIPTARTATTFDRKESVLDRFRAYTGEKTQAALEGLFTRWDPVFSQNPAVILSDGSSVAHITLRLQGRSGEPPTFSISGGHCVSAKMTDTGNWALDILPKRGTISTSLTVVISGQMTEYPLTVAPPMELFDSQSADESVRDYVMTANHLVLPEMVPVRK